MCAVLGQGVLPLLSSELIMSGVQSSQRRCIKSTLSRKKKISRPEVKRDCIDREDKRWGQLTSRVRRLRVRLCVPSARALVGYGMARAIRYVWPSIWALAALKSFSLIVQINASLVPTN
jgi:hypothetical protein